MSIIHNSWKHLIEKENIVHNLLIDHFDSDDDIPLVKLYRLIDSNSTLTDEEIVSWAEGNTETSDPQLEEVNETGDAVDQTNIEVNGVDDCYKVDIDELIRAFNKTLEWAENETLPVNEILLLRKIRNKALVKKFV